MHRRITAMFLSLLCILVLLSGCKIRGVYQDGVYRAEFENYDSSGYKDMLQVTVEDNEVVDIRYDAIHEDGTTLRSYDEKYAETMMDFQNTSPEQYSKDLINQFMAAKGIEGVDSVAGATYSSRCFIQLYLALEASMVQHNESLVIVQNLPEG